MNAFIEAMFEELLDSDTRIRTNYTTISKNVIQLYLKMRSIL